MLERKAELFRQHGISVTNGFLDVTQEAEYYILVENFRKFVYTLIKNQDITSLRPFQDAPIIPTDLIIGELLGLKDAYSKSDLTDEEQFSADLRKFKNLLADTTA